MKTYTGSWTDEGAVVLVDGRLLNPRLDLANKSPTGFAWGYGGSGPGQLALAILADCLQDDGEALQWYQDFKWRVIAGLDRYGWTLTSEEVTQMLDQMRSDAVSLPG